MYITRWFKAGEYLFIRNVSPKGFGAPGRKRQRRGRDTPKAMTRYNNMRRSEKLQMLILENFNRGYHVTLDYPKDQRPQSYEEAEDNLKKCLYKVSRRLKKQEHPFKYIAITERGKRAAALHHHLIIEGEPWILEELTRAWGDHIKISQMYEDGAYKDLADYFTKIETKEEQTKGKSKYHRSRNLKEPLQRTAIMQGQIREEPEIPKGYRLIPETLVNGFNERIGIRYQHFTLRRTRPAPRRADPPRKVPKKKPGILKTLRRLFKKRRS